MDRWRRILFAICWAGVATILITTHPSTPFVLLEPLTADFFVILGLFFITSIFLLPRFRRTGPAWLNFAVVAFLLLIRPKSFLIGRDACTVIFCLYLLLFVKQIAGLKAQVTLLVASILGGLFI